LFLYCRCFIICRIDSEHAECMVETFIQLTTADYWLIGDQDDIPMNLCLSQYGLDLQ